MKTTLVATLTTPPSDEDLRSIAQDVGILEVRADLLGDVDVDRLRDQFPGRLLYTLRSKAEGGEAEEGRKRRAEKLRRAGELYDLVDLEADRDLTPELLVDLPEEKRILSWHGPTTPVPELESRLDQMSSTPAKFYKLIPGTGQDGDGLRPMLVLHKLKRDDVVLFAGGEMGSWTRPIAPRLGCPLMYGALGELRGAPGQMTVRRLIDDYGLPNMPEAEALYGIAGRPVLHSLSPRLHNGAYRALGIPALYVPFHVESFGEFWLELVETGALGFLGFPLRGLSVTSPYKEVALAVSGVSSPRSQHISAANTLVLDNEEVWEAETTDPEGVSLLLSTAGVEMKNRSAAVVGCGGAGKAAAYGLELAGAKVTLVNRGLERGEHAAEEMMLPFQPLRDFEPKDWDLIVHATALGHGADDPLPFSVEAVRRDAVVVDLVYGSGPTPLVRELRASGRRAFGGRSALLYQALEQFRLMTGRELSETLAREILGMPDELRDAPTEDTP